MKRMVKNGNLIDVEPDGTITACGKAIKAVEANPTDESTATLEKVKIGDVAYNVGGGGGGGSDYTAGRNIEISEAKEIAVKRALSEIDSIRFKSDTDDVGISAEGFGKFVIKTYSNAVNWPVISLRTKSSTINDVILKFSHNRSSSQTISFSAEDSGDSTIYAFLTRGSKVPFVPSGDGTYVLKATVSNGKANYSWVAE